MKRRKAERQSEVMFIHTYQQVLDGTKTQTRRICKPGQRLLTEDSIRVVNTTVYGFHRIDGMGQPGYFNGHKDRVIYRIGQTLAVQPARTAKSIARIRITGLRCEDVRNISEADVKAEGFEHFEDFMGTWCFMHDAKDEMEYQDVWAHGGSFLRSVLATRPAERYTAWVIEFELVKP